MCSRLETGVNEPTDQHLITFSALTVLIGRQEEHPACKNPRKRPHSR